MTNLEVSIYTHIEGSSRFVVGGSTGPIHIGISGGVAHSLRITGAELAFVEQIINPGGDADILGYGVGAA